MLISSFAKNGNQIAYSDYLYLKSTKFVRQTFYTDRKSATSNLFSKNLDSFEILIAFLFKYTVKQIITCDEHIYLIKQVINTLAFV